MTTFQFTVKSNAEAVINSMIVLDEGGWVVTEYTNDPGGLTIGGMTYATFADGMKKYGESPSAEGYKSSFNSTDRELVNAVKQRIIQVYYDKFYTPLSLDNCPIAGPLLSCAVNAGLDDAIKILQAMSNEYNASFSLKIDGVWGPNTANAVKVVYNSISPGVLRREFTSRWRAMYVHMVQANVDAWEVYTATLQAIITGHIAGHPTMPDDWYKVKAPKFKRWKVLEGWLNRVQRYV